MRKKNLIIGLSIFLVLSMIGFSKAKGEEKSLINLGKVIVTTERVEEQAGEITSNVTIIDEEEIRSSSAKDLGDLLAEKGIGHIQKYPGLLTAVGIRGFRTETHGNDLMGHILVLLNGRRAGTGNAAKIMSKNIERIEIIRGPAAVQYGSAAMGGVINVITKKGKGKPKTFVDGMLGSFDHEEGGVGFSGKVEKFDFSGSFTTESRGDYNTADGERYYNTGYDKDNFSLNLGYEFLSGDHIGFIYNSFDADKVGNPNYLSQNDLDDYVNERNESIDFIYDGVIPNSLFSWKARYFDGKDEDAWFDPTGSNPDFWDDGVPSEMITDQKGTQVQVSTNWENSRITTGFDWVNYQIRATWIPEKTEYNNPSYFLLAKTKFLDKKLILDGGLRYDRYEVKVKEPAGRTEDDNNLSPRFGLAYPLTDNLKLRANYGEAFVMPAADQMAADYVIWGDHYIGNSDLDPEKSKTYEGGLDFSCDSFNSAITYFSTDFKDKIEVVSKSGNIKTWENIGKATIKGLEGDFSYDIRSLFLSEFEVRPYISFVYLTDYNDEETDENLKYTSDLNVSYGIAASDLKGLSAKLNIAYTGEQDITDYEGGTYTTIKKRSFTVANFTIDKKILDYREKGGLVLRGEIRNILDKDHEYVQGYPAPGRSFFLSLRCNY